MFLLVEVFQGYRTIKRMTDAQVQKFQLRQFNEPIEMEPIGGERVMENFNAKKVNQQVVIEVEERLFSISVKKELLHVEV